MPRRPIGEKAMTPAERQRRRRGMARQGALAGSDRAGLAAKAMRRLAPRSGRKSLRG